MNSIPLLSGSGEEGKSKLLISKQIKTSKRKSSQLTDNPVGSENSAQANPLLMEHHVKVFSFHSVHFVNEVMLKLNKDPDVKSNFFVN